MVILAIGYVQNGHITVKELIAFWKTAIGKNFEGYKGGLYRMDSDSAVWVAMPNEYSY